MKLPPQIFREYDVRGIAGKDLTEEVVEQLRDWGVSPIGDGSSGTTGKPKGIVHATDPVDAA